MGEEHGVMLTEAFPFLSHFVGVHLRGFLHSPMSM